MHYQAILIHAQGGKARDQEWVMLVTEFLGMYTNDLSRELLAQATDIKAYLSALTAQLKAAASGLESGLFSECCVKTNSSVRSDVLIESHPALTVEVPRRIARPIGTEDGFLLDVAVRNGLPSVDMFKTFAVIKLKTFCVGPLDG